MGGLRDRIQTWLIPRPLSFYRGIELRRCRSDGQLVFMNNLEPHAGHMVISPVSLSLKEKLLIWLKILG